MQNINIKSISVSENLSIVDELVGELHDSELDFNPRTERWENMREDYLEHIQECMEECDGTFLIAEIDGEPIGFLFGYVEEKDNSNFEKGDGDDLYVSEGYVKKEFRKLGVYSELNKVFEEKYRDRNIRRIFRYTLSNNETMKKWLKKQDYKPVRIVYEKWIKK